MRNLLILSILLLGACVHEQTILFSDGKQALTTKCDATKVRCYSTASAQCPKGYDVLEENQMVQVGRISGQKTMVGMVFRCKSVEAVAPVSH